MITTCSSSLLSIFFDFFPVAGGIRFAEDLEEKKCFIHVKIQSCQEARNIRLRLEGESSVPLHDIDLDLSELGNEQDICFSVPCKYGQLTEPVMLRATPVAWSSLNIVVSPEKLSTDFQGLQQDSAKCFNDARMPGDITVTCKEQQLGQCVDISCMFIKGITVLRVNA